MPTTKRQIFLNSFLRLYGVVKVELLHADTDKITGTAIYFDDTPDNPERQDFCWHMTEDKVPSDELIELIQIIHTNKFNQGDKVTVSPDELFLKTSWSDREKFNMVFDELFEVEVRMVDDGEETDGFFMHD